MFGVALVSLLAKESGKGIYWLKELITELVLKVYVRILCYDIKL